MEQYHDQHHTLQTPPHPPRPHHPAEGDGQESDHVRGDEVRDSAITAESYKHACGQEQVEQGEGDAAVQKSGCPLSSVESKRTQLSRRQALPPHVCPDSLLDLHLGGHQEHGNIETLSDEDGGESGGGEVPADVFRGTVVVSQPDSA